MNAAEATDTTTIAMANGVRRSTAVSAPSAATPITMATIARTRSQGAPVSIRWTARETGTTRQSATTYHHLTGKRTRPPRDRISDSARAPGRWYPRDRTTAPAAAIHQTRSPRASGRP